MQFTNEHMRIIEPALEILEDWTQKPWQEISNSEKEKAFWAKAMNKVMPLKSWQDFFFKGKPETKSGRIFNFGLSSIQTN
ncbi:hypothetical protein AAKU58_000239 [Oxalobacteraceae bacterium GrIS 1.18]